MAFANSISSAAASASLQAILPLDCCRPRAHATPISLTDAATVGILPAHHNDPSTVCDGPASNAILPSFPLIHIRPVWRKAFMVNDRKAVWTLGVVEYHSNKRNLSYSTTRPLTCRTAAG